MTSLDIRQFVHEGEYILVQVKRDATNLKGARVSTHISLPGRFCVYLPNADFITVSQKITKEEEKNRLKEIAKKYLPEHTGVILRTSVEGKSEEVIKQDLMEMQAQWETIQKKAQKALAQEQKQTQLLYQVEGTNDEKIAKSLQEKLAKTAPQIEIETTKDIEALYRYEKQVEKVSNRKIWLACGGFITIDKTEALTAIDVNSGKFTGKQSLAETILKVNEEATVEITKQLRARDIGGIIIIDYIDMERKQDKEKILSLFAQEMKKDRSKIQIVGFTPLDLLEVTRKHMCSNLENKEEEKHENKI